MRFAVAHKVSTYLMVGFAYLAMVTGGGLPGMLTLGSFVALVVSWWWEPPLIRFEKWSWVWTVLSLLALAYSLLTAIATGDFLGVGAQFLLWLTIVKAYNRRAARDWQQMYLLAFLMLVAGSVLNADLTYGLFFLGFVISSTWALTLFHLRREMEDNLLVKHASDRSSERVEVRRILDSRRIVGGRFFAGTGALSFGIFVAAAVVFLALPRVGIGFFLKSRGGLSLSGFSDGVKLGGHGVIKSDPTVVMRVEIDSRFGGRQAAAIHWRGVAFDHYTRGQWSRSRGAPVTKQTLEQSPSRDRRVLSWANKALSVPEIDALIPSLVRQDIWLDPLDSDVLFGASNPRVVEYAHALRRKHQLYERNDEIRLEHGSTVRYTVFSELGRPPEAALRASAGPLPKGFQSYLQLPVEITQRTRDLAKQIVTAANATNNYDKAVAIERWLDENATYTLEQADPGEQEAVDFFLFDRKKGHCEFFASAFAILARAEGIPVRQVNGFLGGEWNEYQGYVAVRAGDAHSWAEVFFPGVGGAGTWVTFDPTPADNLDQLGRGGDGWRARLARIMDTLRFQWSKWVIEYDLVSQLELLKAVGGAFKDGASWVKDQIVAAKDATLEYWYVVVPLVGGLAFLIYWRIRRRRDPAFVGHRHGRRARTTIAAIYDRVAKQLAKSGHVRDAAVTPRELAKRMHERGAPAAALVGELVELYYAAEWGGHTDDAALARAESLAREIGDALTAARKRAG